jgi:rhamnosyltransferase
MIGEHVADDHSEYRCDVSVTLLTHNGGPLLRRLLEAVRGQDTERVVEIVAVDSGSTDGTLDILREFDARVTSIPSESFNFGRTRDQVFDLSRGKIVICLSQDAIPAHPHWLENLIAPLDDPEVAASCGRSIPDPDRGFDQFPWERNGWFYFTAEMRKFRERYGRGLSNANSAIRRSVCERLRFGEQAIGEDFLLQTKLHAEGARIAFPEDAAVLHHHTYTLRTLYKRCRNEGMGLVALGCDYTTGELVRDFVSLGKYKTWLREFAKGNLRNPAALLFPIVRPVAVYVGCRYGTEYLR